MSETGRDPGDINSFYGLGLERERLGGGSGALEFARTRQIVDRYLPAADHVWLHDGLDILSVCVLLFALANVPPNKAALRLAAVVAVLPAVAMIYGLLGTPYWSPVFLVPGAACLAFAVYGLALSRRAPITAS